MSTPQQPSRLDELLSAACNGNLTVEQVAELDALLLRDPNARLAYLHHVHVEAKLHRIFRSKAALAPGETTAFQQALSILMESGANAAIPAPAAPAEKVPAGARTLHDAQILPASPNTTIPFSPPKPPLTPSSAFPPSQ